MSETDSGIGTISALQDFDLELQNELAEAITALGARSDKAFVQAAAQLEAVRAAATEMTDHLEAETTKVVALIQQAALMLHDRFAELEAGEKQQIAEVSTALSHASDGLAQIDAGIEAIDAGMQELEGRARSRLDQFVDAMQQALQDLHEAMSASEAQVGGLFHALEALGADAQQHARDAGEALQSLGERIGELVEETCATLEQAAKDAGEELGQDLQSAIDDLGSTGEQALDAIHSLMGQADELGGSIDDEVQQVIDLIQKIVDIIDAIRPILELAEQLD